MTTLNLGEWLEFPDLCAGGWQAPYVDLSFRAAIHRDAYEWFENVNDEWLVAIGANVTTTSQIPSNEGECRCYIEDIGPEVFEIIEGVNDAVECTDQEGGTLTFCQWFPAPPVYQTTVTMKQSDGVVLAESAMNLTGAQYPPEKLDNSSHMQMRNNEALKNALLSLYGGNAGGAFFETEPQ